MTAATITHPNLHAAGAEAGAQRQEFKTIMGWPPPVAPGGAPASPDAPPPARDEPRADRPARTSLAKPRPAAGRKVASLHAFGAGDVVASRYRLDGRIADGGMGGVWAATDVETGRDVVVKVMSVELRHDDDAVKRFEQEAQAMASVRSPHVVELIGHGVIDGTPYLVLERLRGEDLAHRLERGPLALDECARMLDQMASALGAAHAEGIVHRDIKPANIFLADVDAGEEPTFKLLDFGIAKLQNHARIRTKAGVTIGSPHFMSPEQVQGAPDLDGRSDLFALAAVLYACVTGKLPFLGADLSETFQRILRNQFDPPSAVSADIPAELDGFFQKALALEPDERWATAGAMARAFREVVDEARGVSTVRTPSTAPPPRASSRPPTSRVVVAPDDPAVGDATAPKGAARPAASEPAPRPIEPARPASIDPPALRAFGPDTQAALRAHLVAPLARAAVCEVTIRAKRKNVAYAAAALVSLAVTVGAVWQWSHEKTAEDRPRSSEAPAAPLVVP
jgi:serine/threonine-protein kinase